MALIWLLGRITFKEGIRNRVILGIFLFAILLTLFNIIVAHTFTFDLSKVAVDLGLSMVSLSGLAVIFFMGINLLARDFEKRTIYMVISRPIARWQYVVGKYLGLAMLVGLSVTIIGSFAAVAVKIIVMLAPFHVPPNFSWSIFWLSLLFVYLSLLVVTALAQFFTSITTSSFIALLLSACAYFIGHNMELARKMFTGREDVSPLLKFLVQVATWIFPNLSAFDIKAAAAYGLPIDANSVMWVSVYGISYVAVLLILTIFFVQRREVG